MIKCLAFSDVHYSRTPPESRTEDYSVDVVRKLGEIVAVSRKVKPDFILFAGDLFHRKERVTMGECRKMVGVFKLFESPVYGICGSHDVSGHQADSVYNRALGVLQEAGLVTIVGVAGEVVAPGVTVAGASCHYNYEQPKSYSVGAGIETDDVLIWLSHGVLVEDDSLPFEHTKPSEIVGNMEADILVNGHYHAGPTVFKRDNKLIMNVGSVTRTGRDDEHKPGIVMLAIDAEAKRWKHRFVELKKVNPHDEVFEKKVESAKMTDEDITSFVEALARGGEEMQEEDLKAVVGKVCEGREENVKAVVTARLGLN